MKEGMMLATTSARTRPIEEWTVCEVMTRDLLTIAADDTMLMAWELMRSGDHHHLPVVTEHGHLLGVLEAETIAAQWQCGPDRNRRPAGSLLQGQRCVSVGPADPVATAAQVMTHQKIDAVAVIDSHDRLVGLVTARGLVAALAGVPQQDAGRSPSTPSLYRIEPVMPPGGHPAGEQAHSMVAPD
jgi:CBS domain-containing protein